MSRCGGTEARCNGKGRDAFDFTAPKGGRWRYEVFLDDRWKKIRALAEVKGLRKRMTMYGLRHSLLTWLASEGVDLLTLRTIAGHKRASIQPSTSTSTAPAGITQESRKPW